MDVGFIGLGAMGSGMARNLLAGGHTLRVWNRSPDAAQALAAEGAIAAATPAEAAQGDALITMLADDKALRAVIIDGDALVSAARGLIHIGCSTISIALAKELTEFHAAKELGYVAAPVFGRPNVAAAGDLNIVAAGHPEALSRVQPLLDLMGQKTWPVGSEPYRANVVKIGGNFMIGAAIEAMAEATTLGQAHGLDATTMLDIYTNTLFASPVYKGYGAQIAERRFEPPGFKLRLGLKDVRLALEAGDAAGVPMPIGSVLRDALLSAVASGDGDKDWAALALVALDRAGLDRT